jgi:hypothetical protein
MAVFWDVAPCSLVERRRRQSSSWVELVKSAGSYISAPVYIFRLSVSSIRAILLVRVTFSLYRVGKSGGYLARYFVSFFFGLLVSLSCAQLVSGSRGSSGSIVSVYGLDDRAIEVQSPTGADFSSSPCVQTGSGAHPASPIQWVLGVLSPVVKRCLGVTLTTHPHLVPRLRMYTSSPPCASMACSGGSLYFTFLYS